MIWFRSFLHSCMYLSKTATKWQRQQNTQTLIRSKPFELKYQKRHAQTPKNKNNSSDWFRLRLTNIRYHTLQSAPEVNYVIVGCLSRKSFPSNSRLRTNPIPKDLNPALIITKSYNHENRITSKLMMFTKPITII